METNSRHVRGLPKKDLIQAIYIPEEGKNEGKLLLCLHIRSNTKEMEWTCLGGKHDTAVAQLTLSKEAREEMGLCSVQIGQCPINVFHHWDTRGYVTSSLYEMKIIDKKDEENLEKLILKKDEIAQIICVSRTQVQQALIQKPCEDRLVLLNGFPISFLTHRILRWLAREYDHPNWHV